MKKIPHKKPTLRAYEYVGPKEILKRVKVEFQGEIIESSKDIFNWMLKNINNPKFGNLIICTFIINLKGELVISSRHSEHVQCALGQKVKSAGEIGFLIERKRQIYVDYVTNQSTGYCPSAKSWPEVEKALKKIEGLNVPKGFEPAFVFSYCQDCKTRQIVKDQFYFCAKCEQQLLSEDEFQARRKTLEFR